MHGLIFRAFEQFSRARFGPAVEQVWATARYAADRAYPDEDFTQGVDAVAAATATSSSALRRGFGAFAGEHAFAELYPAFYADTGGTIPFLLTIEHRIHELVRTTIPGAAPPRLHAVPLGTLGVVVSYTSERALCDMVEGLIEGTARFFSEAVEIEQVQCLHRGDPACVLTVQPH